MSVVGFLRLQWLKYKNYRENRNLIAKILSYCEKKIVFSYKKDFDASFLDVLKQKGAINWNQQASLHFAGMESGIKTSNGN